MLDVYISKFGIFNIVARPTVNPKAPIMQMKGIEKIKKEIKNFIPIIKSFLMFNIGKTCVFSLLILIDLITAIL